MSPGFVRLAARCLIALTLSTSLSAGDRLTLILRTRVATAPATFLVITKVEPAPENAWLELAIDGENFYRSSAFDLRTTGNQKTFEWRIGGIPCGEYAVMAGLTYWDHQRSDWQLVERASTAQVIGPGCETH